MDRPAVRPFENAWKRAFREGCEQALASGKPQGDATLGRVLEAAASRLERDNPNATWEAGPPPARTLRRWHKALVNSGRGATKPGTRVRTAP